MSVTVNKEAAIPLIDASRMTPEELETALQGRVIATYYPTPEFDERIGIEPRFSLREVADTLTDEGYFDLVRVWPAVGASPRLRDEFESIHAFCHPIEE